MFSLQAVNLNYKSKFPMPAKHLMLSDVSHFDLATQICEIVIVADPKPAYSKALGVIRDVESEKLKVNLDKNFDNVPRRYFFFFFYFYYRSICIIDNGASRHRTRNARFRARRAKQRCNFERRIVIERLLIGCSHGAYRAVVSLGKTLNANIPTSGGASQ